jgi:hypothetical protein
MGSLPVWIFLLWILALPWLLRIVMAPSSAFWFVGPGAAMQAIVGLVLLFGTGPRMQALVPLPVLQALGVLFLVSAGLLAFWLFRRRR